MISCSGDELAFHNHSEFAATVLKPYVSEKTHWIVEKHGKSHFFQPTFS